MKKRMYAAALGALCLCLILGGCAGKNAEEAEITCAGTADLVQAAADFSEMTDANESYLEKYLLLEADDLSDWAFRRDASRATPEMILVLRVREGADQAAVRQAVQDYLDEQLLLYRDYQPEQTFKLENAKVLEKGDKIALIVSPDAQKTTAALGQGWR